MKIYHGSLNQVKKPIIERGRQSTDFGKGFYTTTNIEQAKKWALAKQRTAGGGSNAIVNTYDIDYDLLNNKRYKIKKFDSPDRDWLSFVVNCRKSILHEYDIIFGAVANDKIYTTITLYESQVLTAEETVARLKVNEFYNQISFHTSEAISELRFIESEIIL
ncbi:MAG: DUF3990 domain-containing protein [Prevotella sp.]|jgi:hypothetical protein|nr:DUF3990 domain-containing protein [Prevotella sp.]